jgi:transcriptional regulator with XRE-family HTH domain
MAHRRNGVAYAFYERIETERVRRNWTKVVLAQRSGLSRSTIDNLQWATRAPQARIVHALADVLELDWDEAERLAGLRPEEPADGDENIRQAIRNSPVYTDKQKTMLLDMVDYFDSTNATRPIGSGPPPAQREAG